MFLGPSANFDVIFLKIQQPNAVDILEHCQEEWGKSQRSIQMEVQYLHHFDQCKIKMASTGISFRFSVIEDLQLGQSLVQSPGAISKNLDQQLIRSISLHSKLCDLHNM